MDVVAGLRQHNDASEVERCGRWRDGAICASVTFCAAACVAVDAVYAYAMPAACDIVCGAFIDVDVAMIPFIPCVACACVAVGCVGACAVSACGGFAMLHGSLAMGACKSLRARTCVAVQAILALSAVEARYRGNVAFVDVDVAVHPCVAWLACADITLDLGGVGTRAVPARVVFACEGCVFTQKPCPVRRTGTYNV